MHLIRLFIDIFTPFITAGRIKKDEELRPKSVRLGVQSIIYSVFTALLAIGGMFLVSLGINNPELLVIAIMIIAVGAVLFVGAVLMALGALLRVIAQLSVNKKAIGWIALIILIAAIAVSVVFFFLYSGLI